MSDDKNTSPQDFEMGSDDPEKPEEKPKINNFMNDVEGPKGSTGELDSKKTSPSVNPKGPAPEVPKDKPKITIGQAKSGQLPEVSISSNRTVRPSKSEKKKINPKARKRAMMGCLGAFGAVSVIFLVLAFIFISGSSQDEVNPIAELLGINQASFINGMITLVNVTFILIALVFLVFSMTGLLKAVMAKKEDKETRKKGFKTSLINGILLFVLLIAWAFVFIYLDGKRVRTGNEVLTPIVTEPEETVNLDAPVEVKFDASNVPFGSRNFRIILHSWDFGDGEEGTGQIVSHEFVEKGIYDVVLTVTREDKSSLEQFEDKYTVTVSIANQSLAAAFDATPELGPAPLEVEFDASKSVDPDGTISRYEWDLDGDGDFDDAEGVTAEYEFDKLGRYTVSLRVTSTTDEFDIAEKEIVVQEEDLPEPVITVDGDPTEFITGVSYLFKGEDSNSPNGKIDQYEWDFSDGSSTETSMNVSHTFDSAGTYEVKLTVTDEEDKEAEESLTITVRGPQGTPKASIKTTPSSSGGVVSGSAPFQVSFDASGSTDSDDNIVDYQWDFNGDGSTESFGQTGNFTYTEEGSYTAELSVVDSDGNTDTATVTVEVSLEGIQADVTADKIQGVVPLTVNFDATGSTFDGGSITSYIWNFGDGTSPVTGQSTISHKFTQIGTFEVIVTAIGSDGTRSDANINITINEIPLQACFTPTTQSGPAPLSVTFDPGCSTGTVTDYFWNFGDGSTSTGVKPSHTFDNSGEYTVTLEVNDSQNTVSTKTIKITVTE